MLTLLLNLWLLSIAVACLTMGVFSAWEIVRDRPVSYLSIKYVLFTVAAAPLICYMMLEAYCGEFIRETFSRLDAWASRR